MNKSPQAFFYDDLEDEEIEEEIDEDEPSDLEPPRKLQIKFSNLIKKSTQADSSPSNEPTNPTTDQHIVTMSDDEPEDEDRLQIDETLVESNFEESNLEPGEIRKVTAETSDVSQPALLEMLSRAADQVEETKCAKKPRVGSAEPRATRSSNHKNLQASRTLTRAASRKHQNK